MIGLDVLRDFNQLLPDQFPAQVLKQQAGGGFFEGVGGKGETGDRWLGRGRVAMT